MFDLSGKTALVVGASSGIGTASSQGLAASGASSCVTASFVLVDGGWMAADGRFSLLCCKRFDRMGIRS